MKQTVMALSNFKIHSRRKINAYSPSFMFVKNNDLFRKDTILKGHIKSTAKQLFSLSHSLKFYNEYNIKTFYDIDPKEHLNPKQYEYYSECIKYVPSQYSYFLIDYIASSDNHAFNLEPKKFIQKIGFKFLVNVKSSLNGFSQPQCNNSIYSTIPKPFSPLFFLELQFADAVLKGQNIRKDFEDCFDHLLEKQHNKCIENIMASNTLEELNYFVNKTVEEFFDKWRLEESLKSKCKQVILYTNNLFNINPLFKILIISHIYSNKNNLLESSSKDIYFDIKNNIKNSLYSNSNKLFTNSDIKNNSMIFDELKDIYNKLNNKKVIIKAKTKNNKSRYILVSTHSKKSSIA